MIKYLIMLFTFTTLFSAQESLLVPIAERDLNAVRRITGFPLNNQMVTDVQWCILNSSEYSFDGGEFTFHAHEGRPYRYNGEKPSDPMKVTQRFCAATAKRNIQIIGLNILVPTGVTYELIAYCNSCRPWSQLSKSEAYKLLESSEKWDKWSIAEPAPAELPEEVKKFCETALRFQF